MAVGLKGQFERFFPGVAVAVTVGLSAAFLSENYGAPAMLLAILIGLALHFLSDDPRLAAGLDFAAKTLLRTGIALLGLRVNIEMFEQLGLPVLVAVAGGVVSTILFGVIVAPLIGKDRIFGLLSGGAVAICGASAAMAIAAAISRNDKAEAEREMVFVVIGVTMLSTLAMIFYPLIAGYLAFDSRMSGIFLGATIHDVAQVAGAGFSISPVAGETAVVVKLIRVTMLAPVVLVAAMSFRQTANTEIGRRPPLLPGFVVVFLVLTGLNSVIHMPVAVGAWAGDISRWSLLIAIAAVGIKTSIPDVVHIGRKAIALLVTETVFLAILFLTIIMFLGQV